MQNYFPDIFGDYGAPEPRINYLLMTGTAVTPVSLDEVKAQARLDPSDTSEDTYLTSLINTATTFAEGYTGRDLINKTYIAYLDRFPYSQCQGLELRRSKLQSITTLQYYVNGVLTTWSSSNYYITNSADYSAIYLVSTSSWPSDCDVRKQAVKITFVAGYGADATFVPAEFKQGLLQHITAMYQARGDACDGGCEQSLPATAKAIYDQFKIYTI